MEKIAAAAKLRECLNKRERKKGKELTIKRIREEFIAEKGLSIEDVLRVIMEARGYSSRQINNYLAERKFREDARRLKLFGRGLSSKQFVLLSLKTFLLSVFVYLISWFASIFGKNLLQFDHLAFFIRPMPFSVKDMLMFSLCAEIIAVMLEGAIPALKERRIIFLEDDSEIFYGLGVGLAIGLIFSLMGLSAWQCFGYLMFAVILFGIGFGGLFAGLMVGFGASVALGFRFGFGISLSMCLMFSLIAIIATYYCCLSYDNGL